MGFDPLLSAGSCVELLPLSIPRSAIPVSTPSGTKTCKVRFSEVNSVALAAKLLRDQEDSFNLFNISTALLLFGLSSSDLL